ncbi:hypothetical protein [Vibrio mediterranei]|uniref:Uncharacterized protein n=1 Tax=Vibrio mediterranei TaxID=689 RepID=A0AAN1FHQ1_9VIBR|nr:hypothetical protein [Vibrio mediterranei]ASI90785.1 hypothetical protein BSZ05_13845 [Vibrio mediterranei]
MKQLESNSRDKLVSVAKAASGALPFIGNAVAELLDNVVPNLRFERVVIFLKELDNRVSSIDDKLENFKKNLISEEGIDLLEEGMLQASRAINHQRKIRLASIMEKSLSSEELRYEESKKILNLFRDLTEPELIWLIYFSLRPTVGRGRHSEWVEQHPDVLSPISRELSASLVQREKAALQDSYKETLLRLGLTETNGRTTNLTTLGSMLVRYIED